MAERDREREMVFGMGTDADGAPMVVLGIPTAAWEYMKNGQTHTFDLTRLGYPVKFMVFGCKDHDEAIALLSEGAKRAGTPMKDMRGQDFSITPKKGESD